MSNILSCIWCHKKKIRLRVCIYETLKDIYKARGISQPIIPPNALPPHILDPPTLLYFPYMMAVTLYIYINSQDPPMGIFHTGNHRSLTLLHPQLSFKRAPPSYSSYNVDLVRDGLLLWFIITLLYIYIAVSYSQCTYLINQ